MHGGAGALLNTSEGMNRDRWVVLIFFLANHIYDENVLALFFMPWYELLILAKHRDPLLCSLRFQPETTSWWLWS
jgi:hypothetical protein